VELELQRAGGVVAPEAEFRVEDDGERTASWKPLEGPWWKSAALLSSVLKLALDRLRRSFRNEGAMAEGAGGSSGHLGIERETDRGTARQTDRQADDR
jgi:hypothetical protein